MKDEAIVGLFWARNESAIEETQKKYGGYLHTVAVNILENNEDAEECVNDAYINTWNAIPTARPNHLGAFVTRIVRNLSLDRLAFRKAGKRNAVMEEFDECLPPELSSDDFLADELALKTALNGFLDTLSSRHRTVFLRRYWYFCSVREIAKLEEMSESNVKMILLRTREQLRAYLTKEGLF